MDRREIVNLPNFLTVLRIGLTPLFLLLLFADAWYWKSMAFVVFALASLTDFYDGKLAREGNQVTSLGRFLDPLADKFLVTSALIAFVFDRVVNLWLVVPIITRDVLITGMRLYGLSRGRQMVTSRLAKWKTAVQLFAVVLLLFIIVLQELMARFFDEPLFFLDAEKINILANGLMATVLLLTVLSGVHYIFRASFSVKGSDVHR
jgi:CDP-diacylglycerol--glycerol-3-phosphate 3-phosphatidyltransferase